MHRTVTETDAPSRPEQRFRMTDEEYHAWAEDHFHSEWVDGEVTRFMPPTLTHQHLIRFLLRLLSPFVDHFGLGELIQSPFEMRLRDGRSYREPDILFVARRHLGRLSEERLDGPADLVIEIVSPSGVDRDRVEKFREYAAAGIPEYWLFDPRPDQQSATFFRLPETGTTSYIPVPPDNQGRLHSSMLPGFWLDPTWLWQTPLPAPEPLLETIVGGRDAKVD